MKYKPQSPSGAPLLTSEGYMKNFGMHGKIKIAAVLVTGALIFFSACKQSAETPKEYLSYWSSEAFVTEHTIDSAHRADTAGIQCSASSSDAVVTLKVYNPKSFQLALPTAHEPLGIVEFKGLSAKPTAGTDYTLIQLDPENLKLTYTKSFLQKYEQGQGDLSPLITIKAKDGRVFSQTYTFTIKSNSPPPKPEVVIAKSSDLPSHYVLCLKFDSAEMTKTVPVGSGSVPVHKDIEKITINGSSYSLLYKSDNSDFEKPAETSSVGSFISSGSVIPLSAAAPVPTGAWVLYLKTSMEVESINPKTPYTIVLQDKEGVVSDSVTAELKEKFKVEFDTKGGSAVQPQYIENGGTAVMPSASTKPGFNFAGWYKDDACSDGEEWDFDNHTVTGSIKLFAKWTFADDTKYTVRHYMENVDDDAYQSTPREEKEHHGTTNSTVSAETVKKEYTGFVFDHIEPDSPTINADGSTIVNAYYKRKMISVTFNLNGGNIGGNTGNVTKTGKYGAAIPVPSPVSTGKTLSGWSPALASSPTYPEEDKSYTAQWSINSYSVTYRVVNGQGGSIKADSGSSTTGSSTVSVTHGANVNFTATPAEGWEVDRWSGNVTVTSPTDKKKATLSNVIGAKEVTVTFVRKTHNVKFSVEGGTGGKLKATYNGAAKTATGNTVETLTVNNGGTVSFEAVPNEGYEVERWNGVSASPSNSTNASLPNVTGAREVKVKFRQKVYTVTYKVEGGEGGSIKADSGSSTTGSAGVQVIHGGNVSFTATAAEGWEISGWTVSSGNFSSGGGTGTTAMISNVTDNITVKVTFKPGVFDLAGGDDAWKKLREEAAKKKGAHTITISGEIKATNAPGNNGKISIGRDLIIKSSGSSASLNADGKSGIFNVDKNLILENITLKNGTEPGDRTGAGAYVNSGVTLTMKGSSAITGCSAHKGGGVYVNGGTLIMQDSSTISGCTAADKGGGVYVSGTFNMSGNASVDQNNDVYLESGKSINVTGTLANRPAAKITPNEYSDGRILATGSAEKENFTVTPENGNKFRRYKKKDGVVKFVRGKMTVKIENFISVEEHDSTTDAEYFWTMTAGNENIHVLDRNNAWKPKKNGAVYEINRSKDFFIYFLRYEAVGVKFHIEEKDKSSGDDVIADVTKNCTYNFMDDKWKFEGRDIYINSEESFRLQFRGSGEGDVDVELKISWKDD